MNPDLSAAAARAEKAIAAGSRQAEHFNTLAWHCAVQGDAQGAARLFQKALEVSPRNPEALVGLAGLLRGAGQLRDAALHCDAALAAAPDYPEAWLERAFVMAAGGVKDEAVRCYRRVVELAPGHAAAHAGLAAIAAQDGKHDDARHHAEAALGVDPANPLATHALAAAELEAGQVSQAHQRLQSVLSTLHAPSPERSQVLTLLGDASARLGDALGAYRAYFAAKQDFAAVHGAAFAGRQSHADFIAAIARAIATMPRPAQPEPESEPESGLGWNSRAGEEAARHVFVLGYPRSGNTLLENILASLPDTQALEERPTLREADQAFLATSGGLAHFAQLADAQLEPYRKAYWERVRGAGVAAGGCFVDMDPLKSIRLPLISRLFPNARILLVRRDPRDVVWSCFRTNFALTNAALDFTTLEGTARHYAALMDLIERARAHVPLNLMEVQYHKLVQDFDATTQEICDFIAMPWSEDLRRFDRTARQRGVATASAAQVRRGLYDGTQQWKPFAAYLQPVMPILQPWIERFGYADG